MSNGIIRKESVLNGTVLGGLLGASILYGYKVSPFLIDLINNLSPEKTFLGSWLVPVIVIGGFAIIGYIVDRT